jgi:hypothetical protein
MRRQTVILLAIGLPLVLAGAIEVYTFSAVPAGFVTSTSQTSVGSSSNPFAPGYQTGYQPVGLWANYLGYLPAGYTPAPRGPNAPKWPCPAGMSPSACSSFQSTCGNGVCDPNESCGTCPLDCGPSGEATCDPYTGRVGAPVNVCFVAVN